jgi:hypothetical protein
MTLSDGVADGLPIPSRWRSRPKYSSTQYEATGELSSNGSALENTMAMPLRRLALILYSV